MVGQSQISKFRPFYGKKSGTCNATPSALIIRTRTPRNHLMYTRTVRVGAKTCRRIWFWVCINTALSPPRFSSACCWKNLFSAPVYPLHREGRDTPSLPCNPFFSLACLFFFLGGFSGGSSVGSGGSWGLGALCGFLGALWVLGVFWYVFSLLAFCVVFFFGFVSSFSFSFPPFLFVFFLFLACFLSFLSFRSFLCLLPSFLPSLLSFLSFRSFLSFPFFLCFLLLSSFLCFLPCFSFFFVSSFLSPFLSLGFFFLIFFFPSKKTLLSGRSARQQSFLLVGKKKIGKKKNYFLVFFFYFKKKKKRLWYVLADVCF